MDRLGVKTIAQSYGSDPAAVAKDAQLYAEAHGTDVVIIDTAGRIQTSKNLMEEMSKIRASRSTGCEDLCGGLARGE